MKVFMLRADYGWYSDVFKNNKYIDIGLFDTFISSVEYKGE